jgi:hypothetical protein
MPSDPMLSDPASIGPKSPRPLGEPGRNLWHSLVCELETPDPGSLELLCSCCETMDSIATIRVELEQSAATATERKGLRHDLLAARAFIVKTLGKLRLAGDSRRGPGRPPMRVWPNA